MLSIGSIKQLMKNNNSVSIWQIAKHCNCEVSVAQTIVDHWQARGKIITSQPKKCTSCPIANCSKKYLWHN